MSECTLTTIYIQTHTHTYNQCKTFQQVGCQCAQGRTEAEEITAHNNMVACSGDQHCHRQDRQEFSVARPWCTHISFVNVLFDRLPPEESSIDASKCAT